MLKVVDVFFTEVVSVLLLLLQLLNKLALLHLEI